MAKTVSDQYIAYEGCKLFVSKNASPLTIPAIRGYNLALMTTRTYDDDVEDKVEQKKTKTEKNIGKHGNVETIFFILF